LGDVVVGMRVLHILHQSVPALSGYSVRSNYIVQLQRECGIEVAVVTSARQPNAGPEYEVLDGVKYYRTTQRDDARSGIREFQLMRALQRRVHEAVLDFKPDLIHAHSPVLVGLPGLIEARRNKLPFVYEVRDLWENTSVDRGKFKDGSIPYRIARGLESIVFGRADAVVAICQALQNEIRPRVGARTSLHVVANGVDIEQFNTRERSNELTDRWQLQGKLVISYIGSFQPYEGLPVLIDAMPQILSELPNVHLMITGGRDEDLEARVAKHKIGAHVTFTGRVPHDQVGELYTIADLMVYPRIRTKTTMLTTPLKPLEAMAMGVPVLVSDTTAMLELVEPDKTGCAFRAGDPQDLAAQAVRILSDVSLQSTLSLAGRATVESERQWRDLVASYQEIYRVACVASENRRS
jgi:PEP-CTERM/exosortase A-associated glycosyltransferase